MVRRREHSPSRGRWISSVHLIWGGLILCGALLYVWQHVTVGSLVKEMRTLARQKQRLENERYRLQAEIVYLSRGERITQIASNRIGLVFPDSLAITLYPGQRRESDGGEHR